MANPSFTTQITGGTIKVNDGSVTNPSLAFASNPTSGWYNSGNFFYLASLGSMAMSVGNGFITSFLNHNFAQNIWYTGAPLTTSGTALNTYTGVNASAPITVVLPSGTDSLKKIIKDEAGNALTNNITLVPSGSDKIEGQANFVINVNNGGVQLVFRNSNWNVVQSYKTPSTPLSTTTYNIDGTVLASTQLLVPASRFTPIACVVELTSVSALVAAATISIGSNGTAYNNVLGLTALASLAGVNACVNLNLGATVSVAGSTGIFLRVTTAALATTFRFKVTLIGVYT